MSASIFVRPYTAAALAERLAQHGIKAEPTIESIRSAILDAGLTTLICGLFPNRKPERYEDRFAQTFGEPLTPARTRKRT